SVLVDRPPQFGDRGAVDSPAEIDTRDFGADMRMERAYRDGHGTSPVAFARRFRPSSAPVNRSERLTARRVMATLLGVTTEIQMALASSAPFVAPLVDRLSVRLVVDSYFDLFMPRATHPHVQIEHVSRIPGRERSTLAAEWGLSLHLESQAAGERHQYLLDFG